MIAHFSKKLVESAVNDTFSPGTNAEKVESYECRADCMKLFRGEVGSGVSLGRRMAHPSLKRWQDNEQVAGQASLNLRIVQEKLSWWTLSGLFGWM